MTHLRLLIVWLFVAIPALVTAQTPPQLAKWRQDMLTYGAQACVPQRPIRKDESGAWYYDGMRVYQQIAEYTGDPSWYACEQFVKAVYQPYALSGTPGWRIFPHGLYMDFMRTGDPGSREAVRGLALRSEWASTGGSANWLYSRETAYQLDAYILNELLGDPAHPNRDKSLNYALGHMDQWFVSGTAGIVKPFMVGLTAEALELYDERIAQDPRILPAMKSAADWLWQNAWVPSARAFQYGVSRQSKYNKECRQGPSADLNQLIGHLYEWVFRRTHDQTYLDRSNAIFEGGVLGAFLGDGKHFNQNYRYTVSLVGGRTPP